VSVYAASVFLPFQFQFFFFLKKSKSKKKKKKKKGLPPLQDRGGGRATPTVLLPHQQLQPILDDWIEWKIEKT